MEASEQPDEKGGNDMATETVIWPGASGTKYKYWVYELPANLKAMDGNYIYCKRNARGWEAIYIGEGNLKDRSGGNHHRSDCIDRKGATHIHAHLQVGPKARKAEESDLLALHTEAYVPSGCNKKEGG